MAIRGMGRRALGGLLSIVLGVALAGCTMRTGNAAAVRASLVTRWAETEQAHSAALKLWDRLIFGEVVSCEEPISVPPALVLDDHDRSAAPQAAAVESALNEAITALRASSDVWNIECADGRGEVPIWMARQGRASALAAGPPLEQVKDLFDQWPGPTLPPAPTAP